MHKIGEARKQVDYECDVNSDEIRQRMKGAMISCMRTFHGTSLSILTYRILMPPPYWVKIKTDSNLIKCIQQTLNINRSMN